MSNKKSLMTISAILIIVYHLWVNVLDNNIVEIFIKRSAFIGVDIFFFLSGASLFSAKTDDVPGFWLGRIKTIYVRFFLFAIVAAVYLKWNLLQFVKVVSFVNLLEGGGRAFLWFLPAILIIYFAFPIFNNASNNDKFVTLLMTFLLWCVVAVVIAQCTNYKEMFIWWNRIPVFLCGYYMVKVIPTKVSSRIMLGGIFTAIGLLIIYVFAFRNKLMSPFPDTFYLMMIPATIGIVFLGSCIPEGKVIRLIGSATLEMYGIQMVFGFRMANLFLKYIKNPILCNLSIVIVITVLAVLIHSIYMFVINKLGTLFKKGEQ